MVNRVQESRRKYAAWYTDLQNIATNAGIKESEVDIILFNLKELIKLEREKQIIQKDSLQKISELNGEAMPLEHEIVNLKSAQSELLALALADNEEDFRIKAKQYTEFCRMQERLELIDSQLDRQLDDVAALYHSEEEIINQQRMLKREIDQQLLALERQRNELASLRHQVEILEEGGTYTEKLHRFHQLKSLFNEGTRQWAKKALAMQILQMSMDAYKQDRFPKVIKKAQDYLFYLTDGEYIRILIQSDGNLLIERKDRLLF